MISCIARTACAVAFAMVALLAPALAHAVTVSGRVMASDTGAVLEGTTIVFRYVDWGTGLVSGGSMPVSGVDGTWSFELAPGYTYSASLCVNGEYAEATAHDLIVIPLGQTDPIVRPDYVQMRMGVIVGHVSQTLPGTPADYTWFHAYPSPRLGQGPVAFGKTDANGDFRLPVPAGDYVIWLEHGGAGLIPHAELYFPDVDGGAAPIHVSWAQTSTVEATCATIPDAGPPTVQINANNMDPQFPRPDGETWTTGQPGVWITAVDPWPWGVLSTISYRLNGGAVQTFPHLNSSYIASRQNIGMLGHGTYAFEYWATDLAGNESGHRFWKVHVDHEVPPAPSWLKATRSGTDVKLTWASSVATDVQTYCIVYGPKDVELTPWAWGLTGVTLVQVSGTQTSWTHRLPTTDDIHYAVYAADRAGNVSPTVAHASPGTRQESTVTITSGSATGVPYGSRYTVRGRLTASGKGLSGRTVYLQSGTTSTAVTTSSVKAITDDRGYFALPLTAKSFRVLRASYAGGTTTRPTVSSAVTLLPGVRLTMFSSWTTLRKGHTYIADGYIEPAHAAGGSNAVTIRAYKKGSDGRYHYTVSFPAVYSAHSGARSEFWAPVVLPSAGTWRLRAYHAADALNAKSYGSYDYVTVR